MNIFGVHICGDEINMACWLCTGLDVKLLMLSCRVMWDKARKKLEA